ncbi:Xanthine/uracil permease, partial [Rhodotorula sp. JG-1b]
RSRKLPFFGPNDRLPVVLALVLGLQHALAMVGGLVVPPLLLGGSAGAALAPNDQTYLVSAALIWCGLGTFVQVSRIPLGKGFFLGSGVLNVIGTSFAFVNSSLSYLNAEYNREGGLCTFAADGTKNPCPEAFGALLGTGSVVGLIAILFAFTPSRILRKLFPPLITGSILLCIGLSLMSSGITNWAGGSSCESGGLCPNASAPHAAPWGSPRLIGLGFSVWASIVLFDLFGPPLVKNMSTMLGFLVGIIIAAACGYFQTDVINSAPVVNFLWVRRFPLSVRGELVLPFMASFLVVISEAVGNITATCNASGLPVKGPRYSSHIQGGLLSDALWACLSGVATVPPTTTFSQNVSVIALSNNASRIGGFVSAGFLLLMGIFAKFGAVWVACPSSVIGGLTVFLFASVAVAGLRILSQVPWTRRSRFIATASLSLGFAAIVNPSWFGSFFSYEGSNHALRGFLDALTLIVEESYLITMFIAIPLELLV